MSLFDNLPHLGYSYGLHQQLRGMNTDCSGYTGDAIYSLSGMIIIAVSACIMLNYYYGVFNSPRFTHRRVWLLNMLVACGITGAFSYFSTVRYLPEDMHCVEVHFTWMDCTMFALTQMGYTAIACFIFSLLFKWKSVANKKVPF